MLDALQNQPFLMLYTTVLLLTIILATTIILTLRRRLNLLAKTHNKLSDILKHKEEIEKKTRRRGSTVSINV